MTGLFITFEGIDGSGKSTAARNVYQQLKNDSCATILTREPTQTWLGDAVKRSCGRDGSPFTDLFLFMADRAEHTAAIRRWVSTGKTVLCDRYMDSTIAYQGVTLKPYIGGKAIDWLVELHRNVALVPDITFLLKINPKVAILRISGRKKKIKYEKVEFLRKVQNNYLALVRSNHRFVLIDASQPPEVVTMQILTAIRKRR